MGMLKIACAAIDDTVIAAFRDAEPNSSCLQEESSWPLKAALPPLPIIGHHNHSVLRACYADCRAQIESAVQRPAFDPIQISIFASPFLSVGFGERAA